jgi:nicotinate-nucleotide pyrophosphorylase (carboxylating)
MSASGVKKKPFHGPAGFPGIVAHARLFASAALAEDVGPGDVTTASVINKKTRGRCRIIAREDMTLSGLFVARQVFRELDRKSTLTAVFEEGQRVRRGRTIAIVEGRLGALLTGERVALNIMQRMSGVATLTAEYVKRVRGTGVRILDTRKTTPCMRMLEKYSVAAGGGSNHRFGLYDQVLIKDNHIKAAGGIEDAVASVRARLGPEVLVEVEAATISEVRASVAAGADIIMLDNMTPDRVRKAMKVIDGHALVELSGGITLETVAEYAATGADFISVGALTHSAPSVDISMDVVEV